MVNVGFVIYADLETMIWKEEMVRRGKVWSKHRHVPISVGALTVCKDRPEFGRAPISEHRFSLHRYVDKIFEWGATSCA